MSERERTCGENFAAGAIPKPDQTYMDKGKIFKKIEKSRVRL